MTKLDFIAKLSEFKKRVTPVRIRMFETLKSAHSPIAADKIVKLVRVNKTTVYRDLNLFSKFRIIDEVDFGDGTKRYELSDLRHHHHLVCVRCKNVQDVSFDENLESEESKIKELQKFQVLRHDLEFFGYCQDCNSTPL